MKWIDRQILRLCIMICCVVIGFGFLADANERSEQVEVLKQIREGNAIAVSLPHAALAVPAKYKPVATIPFPQSKPAVPAANRRV